MRDWDALVTHYQRCFDVARLNRDESGIGYWFHFLEWAQNEAIKARSLKALA